MRVPEEAGIAPAGASSIAAGGQSPQAARPLRCRGWRQEAILRLLENNLAILEDGHTLVVQSGKPIAVLPTGPRAPAVLLANGNLVGRWASPEVFYDLERRGLIIVNIDEADKRTRRLALTSAGRALLAAAVPVWTSTHAAATAARPLLAP